MAGDGAKVGRRALLVAGGGIALGTLVSIGTRTSSARDDTLGRAPGTAVPAPGGQGTGAGTAGPTRLTARKGRPAASAAPGSGTPGAAPSPTASARPSPGGPAPATSATPSAPPPPGPVGYLDDGPKVIALTIDDGPSPVYTPQVLAILEKYQVRAAFSMVGENVSYYPGVAREVAAAGHLIVNHTWDHADMSGLSTAKTRAEIERAATEIHAATGQAPRLFRAPYGAWTPAALRYCAAAGLTPLAWSVDPRDWSRPGVRAIVKNILATTQSGSIILEHDGGGDRSQTVAALKTVIPRLLDAGYRFEVP